MQNREFMSRLHIFVRPRERRTSADEKVEEVWALECVWWYPHEADCVRGLFYQGRLFLILHTVLHNSCTICRRNRATLSKPRNFNELHRLDFENAVRYLWTRVFTNRATFVKPSLCWIIWTWIDVRRRRRLIVHRQRGSGKSTFSSCTKVVTRLTL